ncbi:MAG: YcaQ family DNA glycosylase [Candidatus Bathyarchaeota archaeon]|nr:MAG: YcaQ family DNA glycosylase [Candidatus Bathyarchaeota archaeon]
MRTLSNETARRIAVTKQRLAGNRPPASSEGIMDVVESLGYLQFDPIRVVDQSHRLVLWSRLGPYDPTDLDHLLWEERRLFEDWAQTSSIVPTDTYPIFSALKRSFATGNTPWAKRIRGWTEVNVEFRNYILDRLGNGPLFSKDFVDKAVEDWQSTGWTAGRNVAMMLNILRAQGHIMIAGRQGGKKRWALTEHHLPAWVSRKKLSDREVFHHVAETSLQALGVASPNQVKRHYIRGCCPNIEAVLAELEEADRVTRVGINEDGHRWRGSWYIHTSDLPLLEKLVDSDEWNPRTTLLSPFDNLICDRSRAERLFNFRFRFEVYVPQSKRSYGCYVMPILKGDRLIGRIDPVMDREQRKLKINAVYAEPTADASKETGQAVSAAIESLAIFLGAEKVVYTRHVPAAWQHAFRAIA